MAHERLRPQFLFDEEKIRQLKQLAPESFEDGKINFETLRQNLGDWAQEEEDKDLEHFGLFWPGKRDARRIASMPPQGTLEPLYGEGLKADGTPDTDGVNNSKNIFIEGENLEVLKILQKSYAGKIKMIYIDPPYNTGNDFVYDDDFTEPLQEYLRRTGQVDEEGKLLTTNKRSDGRFHSKWLSMIYPRLRLARNLLSDDGSIFISIDDNEVHNLRAIMNEIFGEENFIAIIVWQKSKKGDAKLIAKTHEYIIVFAKNVESLLESGVWRVKKEGADEVLSHYESLKKELNSNHKEIGERMRQWYNSLPKEDPRRAHSHYKCSDDNGLYFPDNFAGPDDGRTSRPRYDIIHPITGKPCKKPSTGWRWDEERTKRALLATPQLIHFGEDETTIPCRKSYLKDIDSEPFASVFYRDGRGATLTVESLVGKGVFNFPKDTEVISNLIALCTEEDDIILDFFAGSGSTAHAVYNLNSESNTRKKFICIQMPELVDQNSSAYKLGFKNISQISRERIRKASEKLKKEKATINDLGFRAVSLTNSNYKGWNNFSGTSVEDLQGAIGLFNQEPLIPTWSEPRLLTELMLIEGFTLSSSIEPLTKYEANKVLKVKDEFTEHSLLICLDKEIKEDTIKLFELTGNDIFICLDSAISNVNKLRLSDKGLIKTI